MSLTGDELFELEALTPFVKGKGVRFVRNIVEEHRRSLLMASHQALKKHEDRKAGELLAKSETASGILILIKNRYLELLKKQGDDE